MTAVAGNRNAAVEWTAGSAGDDPITSYTATSSDGQSCSTTTTSCTITGLTPKTSYTFTVTATNADGTSPASAPSNAVTPYALPGAPTGLTATPGDTVVGLAWSAPADDGGAAVQSYVVQQATATSNWTTVARPTGTSATITALTNGTTYQFRIAAINTAGTSDYTDTASATPYVFGPMVLADGQRVSSGGRVQAGSTITVSDERLPAGATVTVVLHSDPVTVASGLVDVNGTVRASGKLPKSTAPGSHTLVLALTLADGSDGGTAQVPITVLAAASTTPVAHGVGSSGANGNGTSTESLAFTGTRGLSIEVVLTTLLIGAGAITIAAARRRRVRRP